MKKLAIALALVLSLSLFAACGSSAPSDASAPSSESTSQAASLPENLDDIMDKLYEGFGEGELPSLPSEEDLKSINEENTGKYLDMNPALTDDESSYYTGVARSAYTEGIVSEPLMMGIAHRVVILRAENAEAAAQLAKDVEANANPAWNVCTEAEKVSVTTVDNVVVLIMSNADVVDKMTANLAALAG